VDLEQVERDSGEVGFSGDRGEAAEENRPSSSLKLPMPGSTVAPRRV